MIFKIEPMGKPRMTQRDKWQKRDVVVRYRSYCDQLNLQANLASFNVNKYITLKFILTMPDSWSKKKKFELNGQPHQQKPDIDNLIKAFLDALCEDDSYVYRVSAEKLWGEEGLIYAS